MSTALAGTDTEIPADKPLTGAFMSCATTPRRPSATSSPRWTGGRAGSDEAKIADLYASFMDADAIEAAGAEPLEPLLARIDAVPRCRADRAARRAHPARASRGLLGVDAESDPGDPNRYVMFAGQGGLGLPDEEYYRLDEYAEIREEYREHVAGVLRAGRRRRPGRAGRSGVRPRRPRSPPATGTR